MVQEYNPLAGSDLFADSYSKINEADEALRTGFSGPEPPDNPVAHMIWNDTTARVVKKRNEANDAWDEVGSLNLVNYGFLPVAGGGLSGPLRMGGNQITDVGESAADSGGAARMADLTGLAPLESPQFTGNATVNQAPETVDSLVRKDWADSTFVQKAGATMTGELTLPNDNATANRHPVRFVQHKNHRHTGVAPDAIKVRGTDLDFGTPATAKCGEMLINTTGSVLEWKPLGAQIQTSVEMNLDTGGPATLDISAHLPDYASWAIFTARLENNVKLHLAQEAGYSWIISENAASGEIQLTCMCRLKMPDQSFYFWVIGGTANMNLWLVGYF